MLSYPAERIQSKLEIFDWLTSKKDKKVQNPGGFLADAIRKDYAAPRGFISKVEQEHRLAAQKEQLRKVEDAKRKAEEEQNAKFDAEQMRIKTYWDGLSQAEKDQVTNEAMSDPALGFFVRQYKRQAKIRSIQTAT